MFKKKVLIISALSLLLSSITAPFASANTYLYKFTTVQNNSTTFTYNVNGVSINSDKELTVNEQNSIYKLAAMGKYNSSSVIQPFGHIIGGSGEIAYGPKYESYTNKTEKAIAELIAAWLVSKVPIKKLSGDKKFFAGYILGKISGWVKSLFEPTYVGYWTTKAPDGYGLYHYYLTVVHYSDDTFTQPIDVQYGEVGVDTE